MKKYRLLLVLLAVTLAEAGVVESRIQIALPTVALPARPLTVEIKAPKVQSTAVKKTKLPIFYPAFQCGCFSEPHELPKENLPPDPLAMLGAAYRAAQSVEMWKMERLINVHLDAAASWRTRQYRDLAISKCVKSEQEDQLLDFFRLAAEAVAQGPDEDYLILSYLSPLTLPESFQQLVFVPDLVITFFGPIRTRFEFDFSGKRVLVESEGKFGFYQLDEASIQGLSKALELVPADSEQAPEPTLDGDIL